MDDLELEQEMDDGAPLEEMSNDVHLATEAIRNSLRMVTVLESIAFDYKEGSITNHQAKYVSFALESAFSDDREALKEVLAAENILERIKTAIGRLFHNIKEAIKKQVDYMQYSYTMFNLQKSRIRKLKDKLRSVAGKESEIKIGINKYMMYGDAKHQVQNTDEYVKQYLVFTKTMTPFMEGLVTLTEDDLWSSLKFYRDYIFGNPDDYIKERFDSLEKALNKAAMGLQDRKTASKPQFVEYDSGTMLGLSKVIVRLPQKSTYSKSDIDTMIAAHRYFYMWVDRRPKINLGSLFEGNVKLMVTKSDVEKILDESEKLIVHANELLSFSNQLSHAGAAMSISLPEMINRRESSDIYDPTSIVKGTQIFARICSVIFDSSSSGYNFSLGNIKNALTIAEKAIGKM